MRARPTRTVAITTTPTNIRKTAAFANDPNAYPVTYATLRYPSGGGTIELIGGSPFARGVLTFVRNASPGETIAINGVTFTFVAGASGATDVHIGDDMFETAAELANVLNASASGSVNVATYAAVFTNIVTIVYDTAGTGGNAFTLADSSLTAITRSGATLTGGQASGLAVAADTDFNDIDQSVARYAVASAGSIDLDITDWEA